MIIDDTKVNNSRSWSLLWAYKLFKRMTIVFNFNNNASEETRRG